MSEQAPPPASVAELNKRLSEIQAQLKAVVGKIEAGRILESFDTLSRVTDAIVTNCESLGLAAEKPVFEGFDRISFWRALNHCWIFALKHTDAATSEVQRLHEEHLLHLQESIEKWCDVLQKYGLVDYEMGFWELDIMDALNAVHNQVKRRQESQE
ncbi:hypothetical protein EV182_001443 [Spiromyces aspiralis]|uniref:Uncharacterized protein n=1 Tax=Spiromyces aspiralis TaxID=68401 RepID=A0ACC1HTV1_9FUNG|nr:hypothetical protein EV182_001443 [Spiromyces aspiralis]